MRVPWTARRSNQLILKEISPEKKKKKKEISPEYLFEGLMLKLKRQYFWPPDAKSGFI